MITGNPDRNHISTSYVERQNLTMRMSMRRFTRLTNSHSKKLANHHHAQALYFMYYNFVRLNQCQRQSKNASAAGAKMHQDRWQEGPCGGLLAFRGQASGLSAG